MKRQTQVASPRKVALRLATRFEDGNVIVRVSVIGETHLAAGASVELRMRTRRGGHVVLTRTIKRLLPIERSEVAIPLGKTPWGCCWFDADLIDRLGVRHEAEVLQDQAKPDAEWLGTADGISRKVPAPWTPVKTSQAGGGVAVECWGRRYEFDARGFAKAIESGGHSLLAGPVRLVAKSGGREIRLTKSTLEMVGEQPDQAVLATERSGGGLSLRAHTAIEFDGIARVDWILSSQKPVTLDSVVLEMPVRKEYAKYLYLYPGRWGSVENAMALPSRTVKMGFRPYIWLGDDDRGLAWFAESNEGWFNRDPERAVEIRRGGDAITLRLHLVSSPVNLVPGTGDGSQFTGTGTQAGVTGHTVGELRYTFGLQATPVKPVEQDAWDNRTICIGQHDLTPTGSEWDASKAASTDHSAGPMAGITTQGGGWDISTALLDRLAASGVRTVIFFEYWADAEGHARTVHTKRLKRAVKACHDRDMKVLFYFSFLISDLAPEWRDFGKDCIVIPKGGYPIFHYAPQPDQSAWCVCLRSQWQDFLAEGIARVMDEFDIDGTYHDGTELPFGCRNTNHGCGTLRPDGSIAPTYPIFGVRSAMRRIYEVVKSRKPDGQLNVHNSTCMTMPTLEWGTSYWDGEQFQNLPRAKDIGTLLPLDGFRAEFMGRQWGVPAEFLCTGHAFTHEEAWSFSLLHDVPVRPMGPLKELDLASAIWRAMDEFGRKESEWLPYWNNEQYVKVSPQGAYVSLYRHPRNGVLAVVSNLGGKAAEIKVTLSLEGLGLGATIAQVKDAMTGKRLRPGDRGFKLRLSPYRFKLIRIEPPR